MIVPSSKVNIAASHEASGKRWDLFNLSSSLFFSPLALYQHHQQNKLSTPFNICIQPSSVWCLCRYIEESSDACRFKPATTEFTSFVKFIDKPCTLPEEREPARV